ncbi:MAG TPA: methyltransferase [Chryseolinea sp.]|nr:methyltransferase [Chryseolinea sp.]
MKRKSHFHFKQFTLRDDQCTMKVGTDGALIGAWADFGGALEILDIGTGSGLIALMAAQRSLPAAFIDGVEIANADARQAAENVLNSPWPLKVAIHRCSIQEFQPQKSYDVIITNPPFFFNSLESPDKRRQQTRHAASLDHNTLIESAKRLLKSEGRLNIILPYTEGLTFIRQARTHAFFCRRKFIFKTRRDKPPERLLLEFRFTENPPDEGEIILYEEGLNWSEEYRRLTADFYLEREL